MLKCPAFLDQQRIVLRASGKGIDKMRIVDMHCDTIAALYMNRERGNEGGLRESVHHIDLKKMRQSGYVLQNFALFVDLGAGKDPWERVQQYCAYYCQELEENRDWIAPVLKFADFERNQVEGKMSALLTVEEGGVCKGQIEKLCKLYEQGVRMLTLTWNYPNELGYPNVDNNRANLIRQAARVLSDKERDQAEKAIVNTPDTERGLTQKGREFVSKMEELGMIVDVSHLSDAGFYDVLECTRSPFVASHSNARAVCPHVRNMTDDMIRRLAERGGVMGLNFASQFLNQKPVYESNPGTVAAIAEHARHIVNVGGLECLGLGSDFDGINTHQELPDAGCMYRLFDALKAAGFTESQIDRIFAGNVLRVYREVLG